MKAKEDKNKYTPLGSTNTPILGRPYYRTWTCLDGPDIDMLPCPLSLKNHALNQLEI